MANAKDKASHLLEEAAKLRNSSGPTHSRIIEEAKVWASIYQADALAGKVVS